MQQNFERARTEIINDVAQILVVSKGVLGITAIINYEDTLMASLVFHDSLLAGVRLIDRDASGDGYMGIIEDPAHCPERWKTIPKECLSARSNKNEPVFPMCYFVPLGDGRYGLALPGRMNHGNLGWSGNEHLLKEVALVLADVGILNKERT